MSIKFSAKENEVICNIIGAVESGGQIYGNRDYGAFAEAYANSSAETAITIGWAQNFGTEAKELLLKIQKADVNTFKKLDTAGIAEDLKSSDWSKYQVKKNSAKGKCIISIITSSVGKKCQDELFAELCQKYINHAESLGVTDHTGLAECINMSHQGGTGATKRVLSKTTKPYNADNIYKAMQSDTGNQVGAYKTRQKLVYEWIKQYWPTNTSTVTSSSTSNTTKVEKYPAGYISNCSGDENGNIHGGKAGDQSGKEWRIRDWYNRPWSCILRFEDSKVRSLMAKLAIEAALNDNIGYDQYERTTFWYQLAKVGYYPSKITVPCETDCSAGVAAITKAVGYLLNITKLKNISPDNYTGIMRSNFRSAGFKVLTASKYLTGPDYLLAGDILLNDNHHTCICISSGAKSGEEVTTVTESASGNTSSNSNKNGSINTTVQYYVYAKDDNTKLYTWAGRSNSQLTSYPVVARGTTLGVCDEMTVSKVKWYFVKVSGAKGDKYGFVCSEDIVTNSDNISDGSVTIAGHKMTLSNGKSFNRTVQWNGMVKVNGTLNFRTWCSTSASKLKSVPELSNGSIVYVCDAIKGDDGSSIWLYVKYKNPVTASYVFGFVHSKYIKSIS